MDKGFYKCKVNGWSNCFVELTAAQANGYDTDGIVEVTLDQLPDNQSDEYGVLVGFYNITELYDITQERV